MPRPTTRYVTRRKVHQVLNCLSLDELGRGVQSAIEWLEGQGLYDFKVLSVSHDHHTIREGHVSTAIVWDALIIYSCKEDATNAAEFVNSKMG